MRNNLIATETDQGSTAHGFALDASTGNYLYSGATLQPSAIQTLIIIKV